MIPSHFTIAHKNRAPSRGDPSTIVSRLKSNSRQCSLVVVDIPMCCCMSLVAASADTRNVVKLIFDGQWRWWASSTTAAIHNSSRLLGRSRSSPSSWMRTFLAETTTTRKRSPNGNKKERNYVGKHDRDEKESFFSRERVYQGNGYPSRGMRRDRTLKLCGRAVALRNGFDAFPELCRDAGRVLTAERKNWTDEQPRT